MTRNDQTEQTHAYATAVAKALGNGWTYADNRDADGQHPWYAQIKRGLATICLRRENRTGRYMWSGEYPRDSKGTDQVPYNATRPSITTAPDKSPEHAARDLTRRFLPDYMVVLAQVQMRIAEANAYADTTARNVATFAKILGTPPDKYPRKGDASVSFSHGEIYGDVTVNGDSIRLDLRSLTVDQAARVLRVLMVAPTEAQGLRSADGSKVLAVDEAA